MLYDRVVYHRQHQSFCCVEQIGSIENTHKMGRGKAGHTVTQIITIAFYLSSVYMHIYAILHVDNCNSKYH